MQKIILAIIGLMLLPFFVNAQQRSSSSNPARIEGRVLEASQGNSPIGFATVEMLPQGVFSTTSENGEFDFERVDPGKITLKIQFIGMETIDTTFNVVAGKVYNLSFKMKESNFRLNELTVTATQSKAGSSTASNISRQAMDHLQASSLKDVMQLLPGVSVSNPNMSGANVITLRTLGGTSGNYNMNSLGTAIIVDGSPLSNNANLQTLSSTVSGGESSASTGVDLRGVSTDNIESIEVIRGIPSAEYGDLTSGAVIIKSKAGREPLSVKFKTNPYTYQASASKGFEISKKAGSMHISADYMYNTSRQTEAYAYYQRLGVKALWSKTFAGNFNTNTSLDLLYGLDKRDRNPDDKRTQRASGAKELGLRFNSTGTLNTPNAGWLKNIKYSLQFSYSNKKSFEEELLGNAFAAYTTAMTDGTIISNKANQKVYDNTGKEITNIPVSELGSWATYLPNEYFSRYDVFGKEINFYGKVVANFNKAWTRNNNRILAGLDFKTDGNKGDGIVYDLANPPMRTSGNSGWRPRAFKDVPFINQLGVFLEDYYTHSFGKRDLNITAGLRFDYVNGKSAFSPRINASFDIIPKTLIIRGGYGINAKAPTALYLYPQKAYFDYINFNNLGSQDVPKDEQLLVGTTRVFDVENKDLKIAKNIKSEIGLDLKFNKNKMRFSLTAYSETLKDGYDLGRDLSCFQLIPYTQYKIAEKTPGGIPKLIADRTYNIFASYYKPLNSVSTLNKGLEYELDLGRFKAIRTSFYINGAWLKTESKSDNYSYSTNKNLNNLEANIGVYEKGLTTSCREKINTTFRITHNIPKIGFVLTLTAQVDWKNKIWTEYGNDTMFEKYISYKDGKVYDFDPSKKDDPEFSYLFSALNDNRFIAETYTPTVIFNFQLSKEIGNFLTASFYVNNIFNSRPLYESKRTPGSFSELGIPTFFCFDVKINLK